jgi:hypothetical protein
LFNIDEDLSETRDLAQAQPAKVKELAALLTKRLRAMDAQMPVDKRTGKTIELPEEDP